jgi:diguanylate cyclase (GGDEF)-like protein
LNTPANLPWLLREMTLLVPFTVIILLSLRLPVVRCRTIGLSYVSAIVFAMALWIDPLAAAIAAAATHFVDARLFRHSRASRIEAITSGIVLAAACASLAALPLRAAARPIGGLENTAVAIIAWREALIAALLFLGVYGAGEALFNRAKHRPQRQAGGPSRLLRAGVALSGCAAAVALAPVGRAYGAWAFAPLIVLLVAMGLVVRRAFEVSSLRRQLAVSQAMGMAGLADAATAEPTALLYRFLHLAQNLVHAERSMVWLVDDVDGEIIPEVGLPDMGEFAGLRTRLGEGLIGSAAERTRPLIVSDAARTQRRAENEPASDSWLLYPIISQKKVLGVAHWMRPASMPFTAEDAAQLEGLVPHVGVAVENLRARNRMRELAATDGLTGLYNHRRICEILRDEMRRSERYNRPLSVLMLDVDSFKSFNDSYGHPSGDDLLRSVAHLLRSRVRTVDKVGRYGGEEFVIVMPETHKDDAFMLAERIRTAVADQAFIIVAGEEIHRTVSVGVASYPEDGLNPQEVIERADEALYRAKDSGRNCVVWA